MKFINTLFLILVFGLYSCNDDEVVLTMQGENENVVDLIAEGSPLFNQMETVSDELPFTETVCLKFIYNFTLIEYDPEGMEVNRTVVTNDSAFNSALKEVAEENYINLSFPISATLEDDSVIEIANKEELNEHLGACINQLQEEITGYCNTAAQESAWVVKLPEEVGNDRYLNSVFTETTNGLNTFFYRGDAYSSSWLFYFIEDELHLNIALENQEIGETWNFDWKVEILDYQTLGTINILNAENTAYVLNREENPDNYCTTLEFTECELMSEPNAAEFLLEDYIECIDIIAAPLNDDNLSQPNIDFEFTFFTNEGDANTNENSIDTSTPYINTENPEVIFVRIEDPNTSEFVVRDLQLVAEECN